MYVFLIARVKKKNFCKLCGAREAGVTVNWICWNLSVDNGHYIITAAGQQIPAEYSAGRDFVPARPCIRDWN